MPRDRPDGGKDMVGTRRSETETGGRRRRGRRGWGGEWRFMKKIKEDGTAD